MEPNIYLIPGLGFDQRIFEKLEIESSSVHFLNWIEPRHNEHLEDYAFRFSKNIKEGSILIGHSFGGILAQEIAQIKVIKKVILISSIRSRDELPGLFRSVDWLGLYPIFTKKLTFATFSFWAKKHAYETKEKQELFKSMVGGYSNKLLQWSLKSLSSWQGTQNLKSPVVQIHGTADLTFPYSLIEKPDHSISGGTHMMVYDSSHEISQILKCEIESKLD